MDCDNDINEGILSLHASTTSGDVNLFYEAVKTLEKNRCRLVFRKSHESLIPDLMSSYKDELVKALQESIDHTKFLLLVYSIL